MVEPYVPKPVLQKVQLAHEKYLAAKVAVGKETEPEQLVFAAQRANEAWLAYKHAKQIVDNYTIPTRNMTHAVR